MSSSKQKPTQKQLIQITQQFLRVYRRETPQPTMIIINTFFEERLTFEKEEEPTKEPKTA